MPIFFITAIDLLLFGTVNETILSRAHLLKPYVRQAFAPSVAYPLFQYCDPRRQPISTAGVKCD
jgi:hypothetical protein